MLSVDMPVGLGQVTVHEDPEANGTLKLAPWAVEEASKNLVLQHLPRGIRI